jgi:hypothetical protein
VNIRIEGEFNELVDGEGNDLAGQRFDATIELPDEFWLRWWAGQMMAAYRTVPTTSAAPKELALGAVNEAEALLAEFKRRETVKVR